LLKKVLLTRGGGPKISPLLGLWKKEKSKKTAGLVGGQS